MYATLVDLLRTRADAHAARVAFTWLPDGESPGPGVSYGELDAAARAIATTLIARGAAGQPVLLLFSPGLGFVSAFFGCLYAGAMAVPVFPPHPAQLARGLERIRPTLEDSGASLVLCSAELATAVARVGVPPSLAHLSWLPVEEIPPELGERWEAPPLGPSSPALLQYTSGSTGSPRGVLVSHGNLIANLVAIATCFGLNEGVRACCWLPVYHDMGLIGGLLGNLYCGGWSLLMSPMSFLQRPLRWPLALSRYGCDVSGGPNFAYELCAQKAAGGLPPLDLSRWRVAFCGAEPIRPSTLALFQRSFGPSGFQESAWYPCYGLAEATLMVSSRSPEGRARVSWFSSAALEEGRLEPVAPDDPGGRAITSCGPPRPTVEVLIADVQGGGPLPPDRVGEVRVAGPSVPLGYWRRPEDSARVFGEPVLPGGAPFLRTGDLGALVDGELYITGRAKDLLIIRGRNYFPNDIEHTVEQAHPALRPNAVVAFTVEREGTEALVLVAEVDRQASREDAGEQRAAILAAARSAVAETHQLSVHELTLIRTGGLPRTSSGKVRRAETRARWLQGTLS